jgi:hypothetical protein
MTKENIPLLDSLDPKYSNLIKVAVVDSYNAAWVDISLKELSPDFKIQILDSNTPIAIKTNGYIWLDPNPIPKSTLAKGLLIAEGLNYMAEGRFGLSESPPNVAEKVLITLGGIPNQLFNQLILQKLKHQKYSRIEFHLFDTIKVKHRFQDNIYIYPIGSELDVVAKSCDTVISGAGSGIWEFLASKKIVGMLNVVQNQHYNYHYCEFNKLALGLGDFDQADFCSNNKLDLLFWDKTIRFNLYSNLDGHVPINGSKTLAERLIAFVHSRIM